MPIRRIIGENPSLEHSDKYPTHRNEFFEDINKLSIKNLSLKYAEISIIKIKVKRIIKKLVR